ncbi:MULTISPECIES: LpqN/LpqT family lipoprotein [Mycobacterium]|uniref:LpqN/LpqT family lipoprotein n=1 Tax=Mycobacterium sp. FLAC0960 TaxID=3053611 RepID=UPI001F0BD23B|nr:MULTISPECIES: LpqN/LpqT family lipoprotein [Mycobacterium]MDM4140365.1 LpqN/LpqT family lipoprotein [Mycobacterium sp. FLAC0960]
MRLGPPVAAAAIVAAAFTSGGCAPKPPDYDSILSKTSTATTTKPAEKPVPLSQYLQSIGVTGEPVAPGSLTDLTVSIPTPPGWAPFTSPNISPQTLIISQGGKFPTARLVVFKLNGEFDPAQVIKHGNDDAQLFQNFKQLDASGAPYNGFPSSMIQGSYDLEGGMRLHSWNRIVIATGSPPAHQRYLVQLTITGFANQAAAQSQDINAIIHGFVVAAK